MITDAMQGVEGNDTAGASATDTVAGRQTQLKKATQLALLVYLLQALHFLFGITAVIGMLVNHTNRQHVQGTFANSHFNWQIATFWILAPAYVLAFYYWMVSGQWWAVMAVFAVASYRILRGWWQLVAHKPIGVFW